MPRIPGLNPPKTSKKNRLNPKMFKVEGKKFICKVCKADGEPEFTFNTRKEAIEHQEAQ